MAGVLQHLRSSTLNKRPNPASMVDGQIAINYASGSPGAFFKDTNGNLVKVGPVHVGATAPNVSPASGGTAGNSLGEQWLDTSGGTYVFKIWDGAAWRSEAGEFVNSTGDTMTGSLTMGPSANLIFEGSTDDGFETTLTVVDPTADRTITLPNVSGTVVTTGDSGTVTSAMIADGTIVNADVNASAAIAGTKISPDFGSQTIQTTGVFSHSLGSASSPTVTFTGDTNTGIYSPGADQVAISTGGSGRLFVSQNRTGVNINPTAFQLQVNENSGAASYVHITNSETGTTGSDGALIGLDSDEHLIVWNQEAKDLRLATSGQERLRITSAGLVGVGTSSPFTILHSAISITGGNPATSGTTDANVIARFQGGSVGLDIGGTASGLQWIQPRSVNNFATNYGLLLCPNGGNVGIGTTSPVRTLQIQATSASFGISNTGGDSLAIDPPSGGFAQIDVSGANALRFNTNGSERARIDSSGRLLVGTSTSTSDNCSLQVRNDGGVAAEFFRSSATSGGPYVELSKSRGTAGSPAVVIADDLCGAVAFRGYSAAAGTYLNAAFIEGRVDGTPDSGGSTTDMPGRLVFSTTADGASSPTERMRIASNGDVYIGNTTTVNGTTFASVLQPGFTGTSRNTTSSTSHYIFYNPNGQVGSIQTSGSATAYNTSSDYRLKENVTPVTDGITRLQQLKPSRFNFIADPDKTVDGFLAHEVQTIVPEAITGEKDAVDDDGNPEYQGIDQSKLVPLLTAALQEAVAKIESLEARLTAAGI